MVRKLQPPADAFRSLPDEKKKALEDHVRSGEQSRIILIRSTAATVDKEVSYMGNVMKRDVYKVNVDAVSSKYIGETEKNLRKVFDQAEGKQWVLFLDDADDLFSDRQDAESIANTIQIMVDKKDVTVIIRCRANCLEKFRKIRFTEIRE